MKRHFYYAMKNCQDAEDLQSRLLTVVTHYQVLWVHLCFVCFFFCFIVAAAAVVVVVVFS